ncbi:DUF1918 domain-containing protein [Nocardia beijingensis]|uniref:DUF1918 domain-containing protein n=1 Tax=Nocardia beijingensis TaxID=95162 RepID=UPI0018939F5B|nr:DUF1918 domain-containing protein [Nocardia beijingensis]MBF6468240.1 DUF1918 domain-containing protein [Nocardia beijingensis]
MHAKVGDWLIVEGRNLGGAVRHGLIEEVHGSDGMPPYLVHWTDTGHRALTFPGRTHMWSPAMNCVRRKKSRRRLCPPGTIGRADPRPGPQAPE